MALFHVPCHSLDTGYPICVVLVRPLGLQQAATQHREGAGSSAGSAAAGVHPQAQGFSPNP